MTPYVVFDETHRWDDGELAAQAENFQRILGRIERRLRLYRRRRARALARSRRNQPSHRWVAPARGR